MRMRKEAEMVHWLFQRLSVPIHSTTPPPPFGSRYKDDISCLPGWLFKIFVIFVAFVKEHVCGCRGKPVIGYCISFSSYHCNSCRSKYVCLRKIKIIASPNNQFIDLTWCYWHLLVPDPILGIWDTEMIPALFVKWRRLIDHQPVNKRYTLSGSLMFPT